MAGTSCTTCIGDSPTRMRRSSSRGFRWRALRRSIVDGAKQVRIFGDRLAVLAQIEYFDGFSAHADQSELLRWLATRTTKPRFYAVHGEPPAAQALCEAVHQRLGLDTRVATRGLTIEL
jgi:metallo-beta-lactamase family protein